jgi:hypothetical protein
MNLFDVIEIEIAKENPANCKHVKWKKTDTDWGAPYGVRMTWTCETCGLVRGRC